MELWWLTTTRPDEGSTTVSDHLSTDAAGRFTFRVPADAVARRSPRPLAVWAATSGAGIPPRLAAPTAHRPGRRSAGSHRVGRAGRTDLTILSPDGKPVAGARVTPIRAGGLPIRPRLTFALETTTDAEGRAVIACLTPEVLGAVRVEAPGFGTQVIQTPRPEPGIPVSGIPVSGIPKLPAGGVTVTLAPVGRIVGRLVAPGGEPIRGVTVRAASQVGGYAGSGQTGSAVVACDPQGRFEIPAIAAGNARRSSCNSIPPRVSRCAARRRSTSSRRPVARPR